MVNLGKLFATEIIKCKVSMVESVYLDLTVLDLSKINMYELWYDHIKGKYIKEAKLYNTETKKFYYAY